MIDPEKIRQWLELESGLPFVIGEMPDEPDEIGALSMLPGAGLALEGTFDRPAFQVAIRGPQATPVSANADQFGAAGPDSKARILDRKIILGNYPHNLWGGRVVYATRTGGAPAPLSGDRDQANRIRYVCTYLAMVAVED